jgi:hypothetical protein
MQGYNLDSVALELKNLEVLMTKRITDSLKTADYLDAAKGLIALDKESYKIEEDARKLRLKGELDLHVYSALSGGYRGLRDRMTRLAQHDGHSREVSTLYRALRFSNEAPNLSDCLCEASK